VADDWQPDPAQQLTRLTYWPDDDPYRRGMLKGTCRGVPQPNGNGLVYVDECVERDHYTSVDTNGACDGGPDGTGAYAGLLKTKTMCLGGSCDAGGNPVYQTTYEYDPHRRPCSVATLDPQGRTILGSRFTYDQYHNVISETHGSDLDASTASNYQIAYAYDGLLRLIDETRTDLDGDLIEHTTYAYDARSNLIEKVQQRPAVTGPGPLPTPTPTATLASTATPPKPAGGDDDDSCAIRPRRDGGASVLLLLPGLFLFLRRRHGGRP
jgi:YD repeat-containing protein